MAAKKKKAAKQSGNQPAPRKRPPQRAPVEAKKSAAKAPASGDVVYSDVRRTMSAHLLGRLLGS